jgi:lipopolysaccharide biosynthesis glycosyltransferase
VVTIYLNYFNAAQIIENSVLKPIQVGRAISSVELPMLGDDEGDNISQKNPSYCELTGIYWAWKNDRRSDYIGFFHYRRFLDFDVARKRSMTPHGIIEKTFSDGFIEKFALTEHQIEDIVKDYDAVVPEPLDVRSVGSKSVWHQYVSDPFQHVGDLKLARKAVEELHPGDVKYFDRAMAGYNLYPGNMFVFKRSLFEEYCEWLFPLLKSIELSVNTTNYNAAEKRVIGYLAERLLTVFVVKKQMEDDAFKMRTLRRVFVENTTPTPVAPPPPKTELPVVSVAASTDAAYLPHMAALVTSVLSNASRERFIEFLVLAGGLGEADKKMLQGLESLHPHCSITFLDMSGAFLELPLQSYFTRSTYFRLAIPELFKNHDKIVFLDTDMVANADVTELFDLNLGDNYVAAVRDLIMSSFVSMGVRPLAETGSKSAKHYLSENLGMGEKSGDYFQAGTLVLNLKAIRDAGVTDKMLKDLAERRFWFLDQDVLNKHLFGRVMFISPSWNTVIIDQRHLSYLSKVENDAYKKSHDDPKIVHFAGVGKPWIDSQNPLSHYYWNYLRRTPWYEKVLFGVLDHKVRQIEGQALANKRRSFRWRIASRVWRSLPNRVRLPLFAYADRLSGRL